MPYNILEAEFDMINLYVYEGRTITGYNDKTAPVEGFTPHPDT